MWDNSKKILEILENLPPWPRFPDDYRTWTSQHIDDRIPIWHLWPESIKKEISAFDQKIWAVYGQGAMAVYSPELLGSRGFRVPGSAGPNRHFVDRVLARPATAMPPQSLLEDLLQTWRAMLYLNSDTQPEVIVRNEWAERAAAIQPAMEQILALSPQAIRETRRAGVDEPWLAQLPHDIFMHDESVDRAIAQLRKAITSKLPDQDDQAAKNPKTSQAATQLRVGALPSKVLVALLQTGPRTRRQLQVLQRGTSTKDDPQLANLLTPSGTLIDKGFIRIDGAMISLTDAGRHEAQLQKNQGTLSLGS